MTKSVFNQLECCFNILSNILDDDLLMTGYNRLSGSEVCAIYCSARLLGDIVLDLKIGGNFDDEK